MGRKYFGTDGVRGRVGEEPMTVEFALRLASAVARVLAPNGGTALVGKDTRVSGYMFEAALEAGFVAAGVDVSLIGPLPTPGIALLTQRFGCSFGVVISASHNPFEDNGIKIFGPDGYKLSDDLEQQIEALLASDLGPRLASSTELGRARRVDDVRARYIEFAKLTLPRALSLEGLRVVVDCAHGAGYRAAPEALWELGAEVIAIGVEPDGFNINRDVGSTAPQALINKVREVRADIGIALDGDADRVLLVDELGLPINGDQVMAVIAESWKEDGRLSRPGIVATVMSNLGLERYLHSIGLSLARTAVGDRHVLEHMREHGYNVGGEQSGHIILSDYTTTGDGLICALQVLAVVRRQDRPVSEVCQRFEPAPQVLKNVRTTSRDALRADTVQRVIADGERRLAGGRLLIRPSGTEPVIRVMGEGDDPVLVEAVVDDICDAIRAAGRAEVAE